MTRRLANSAGEWLARRTSRRGFIGRATLVGSAIAVAPLRYLLEPVTAEAVVRPSCPGCNNNPGSSACCDGYTEFCCSIYGSNECPSDTFYGGYWRVHQYRGGGYCSFTQPPVRYYVDCNANAGRGCDCDCARNDCNCRQMCCNLYQYGNCHAERKGTGKNGTDLPIVCRKVLCHNPAADTSVCSYTNVMYDDATEFHQPCTHCLS